MTESANNGPSSVHGKILEMAQLANRQQIEGLLGEFELPEGLVNRLINWSTEKDLRTMNALAEADSSKQVAQLDQMTELHNRTTYYKDLEKEVQKELSSKATGNDGSNELHVVRFDMGMLSMFNALGGHQLGDKYKITVADILRSRDRNKIKFIFNKFNYFRVYSLGGDEFSALIRGNQESVDQFLKEFRLDIEKTPDVPELKPDGNNSEQRLSFDRSMLIDYGDVRFTQDIKEWFMLINQAVSETSLDSGSLTRAAKFIDAIADRKVDVAKAIQRLRFFGHLAMENKKKLFDSIYIFAAKGALSVSYKDIQKMIRKDFETRLRNYIADIYYKRDDTSIKRYQDPYSQEVTVFLQGITPSLIYG